MDLLDASFWAVARTKKERLGTPTDCGCMIRAVIGFAGVVTLGLWFRDGGRFAEITLSSSVEMKALATLLNATADAKIAQDARAPTQGEINA